MDKKNTIGLLLITIMFTAHFAHATRSGTFSVKANKPGGTLFKSPYDSDMRVRCEFFASGRWTYNPNVGYHGANGHPKYSRASSVYRLPGHPEGSLIAKKNGKKYYYVGNEAAFQLTKRDSLRFVINDSDIGGSYSDNRGTVEVEWYCEKRGVSREY